MARVTIEDCLKNVDSRFSLMHLAVRRVLQLRSGAPRVVEASKNKDIVAALREIAAGKVTPENIRQIEETRALPDSTAQEKDSVTAQEVKEILDAETHLDVAIEFQQTEQEQFTDQDEE
jgi:DNA-directed RNA polymerase subunit omega